MEVCWKGESDPGLKELVREASRALARLDADRLEELALSCEALQCPMRPLTERGNLRVVRNAAEAAGEMAIFSRVLEATRANLDVMNRLRELREGRYEYGEAAVTKQFCLPAEADHGDN